jgi:ArsR family transcriptional regulator, arsenate/arsenite/antimonite-responsive transcriptional repressor
MNREECMQTEIQLFKAISDGTRLRILMLLLNNGELCVCDLMGALKIPQSTVSRHLALLRNAGFVVGERRGAWMYYQVVEDQTLGSAILTSLRDHCSGLEVVVEDQLRCLEFLSTKGRKQCLGEK